MMTTPRVLIAIATYKRIDLLDGLLTSLAQLSFQSSSPQLEIAVIDNDPSHSARETVERHSSLLIWPLHYRTESRPGVTFVRNQALEIASNFDFLAFIDDDEFATSNWLDNLLIRQQDTGAAAVFGPVHPVYGEAPADWIRDWGIHGRYIEKDEPQSKPGATCNCLIDMDVVRKEGLIFDPKMSLTGAEDTLFFSILLDRGYAFERASNALVHEHIPDDRAQPAWLLRRWYRTGITDAIIAGRNSGSTINRIKALIGGIIRMGAGGALVALMSVLKLGWKNPSVMNRLYTVCRGAGMFSYALGGQYEEYGRKNTG